MTARTIHRHSAFTIAIAIAAAFVVTAAPALIMPRAAHAQVDEDQRFDDFWDSVEEEQVPDKAGFLQGVNEGTGQAADTAGLQRVRLSRLVGRMINAVLSLLGVVLLMIVTYAGFLWMTAQGDGDKVKKAKTMLSQAIAGLVIVFAAYAIADFVIKRIGAAIPASQLDAGFEEGSDAGFDATIENLSN